LAVAFTSRSIAHRLDEPVELWLWPNVLNLDAPLVAVLWQFLLARSMTVRLNPFEPCALGLAVWLIYIADHLIDTARPASGAWEPPRKLFFRRHWRGGLALGIAVGLALLACNSRWLWASTVRGGLQLSAGVAGYFSLIHLTPAPWRIRWPREIAVAVLFTMGTFGAVWMGDGRKPAPLAVPAAIFVLLCWTNCSVIEAAEWEASRPYTAHAPNRTARWIAGHVALPAGAIVCLAAWQPSAFALAGAISAAALWLLARKRATIPIRFISPLADLALCSPLAMLAVGWLQ
jgi:hypothetical protein